MASNLFWSTAPASEDAAGRPFGVSVLGGVIDPSTLYRDLAKLFSISYYYPFGLEA